MTTVQPNSTGGNTVPVPRQVASTNGRSGSLRIEICTDDPTIVQAAAAAQASGLPLPAWAEQALLTGICSMQANSNQLHHEQLRAELERATERIASTSQAGTRQLEDCLQQLLDPQSGPLAQASQDAVTRLAHGVTQILSGPSAVVPVALQRSVQQAVHDTTQEWNRLLQAQAAQVGNAVRADREALVDTVREAMQAQAERVHEAMGRILTSVELRERVEAAEQPTPQQAGLGYEDQVVELFNRLAAEAGDTGEATGRTPGPDGTCKVGDAVITVNPGGRGPRLVVEAKRQAGQSVTKWRELMQTARNNRNAIAGLAVTTSDLMPAEGVAIVLLGASDVLVAYDPDGQPEHERERLRVAYLLLRMLALSGRISSSEHGSLDVAELQGDVELLLRALEPINRISKSAASARKSIELVQATSATLMQDLTNRIRGLQERLD